MFNSAIDCRALLLCSPPGVTDHLVMADLLSTYSSWSVSSYNWHGGAPVDLESRSPAPGILTIFLYQRRDRASCLNRAELATTLKSLRCAQANHASGVVDLLGSACSVPVCPTGECARSWTKGIELNLELINDCSRLSSSLAAASTSTSGIV